MVNPFEQTPAEKEEYVLDMLERGYSWPQIMKECHVSPNTISSVKKKVLGILDNGNLQTSKTTKETQAFRLFQEGKSVIDVKMELDIESMEVIEYHRRYQDLRFLSEFNRAYDSVKGNIQPFLHLFDLMNGLGMTPEEISQLAGCGTRLPYLAAIRSALSNEVWVLESQKQHLNSQMNYIQNQMQQHKGSLEFYIEECQRKGDELLYLNSELKTKKNLIQNFDNDDGYGRIKEAAKKETKLLMQNNRVSCAVTLTATLEAIRRYPNNQTLISDIVTSRNFSTTSHQQDWMESHTPQLLQLMQNVQNEIAEQITNVTMNNIHTGNQELEISTNDVNISNY